MRTGTVTEQVIRYSIAPCPLGLVLVAGTSRGVCAIFLADSDDDLKAALSDEFAAARSADGDPLIAEWLGLLCLRLSGCPAPNEVPLDVRGTAFQRRVWDVLRGIPAGQTRTYGQLAAALGRPTAARAVARACATNRVSVLIPCHRVVGADGRLTGYRWGLERKKRLLEMERGRT